MELQTEFDLIYSYRLFKAWLYITQLTDTNFLLALVSPSGLWFKIDFNFSALNISYILFFSDLFCRAFSIKSLGSFLETYLFYFLRCTWQYGGSMHKAPEVRICLYIREPPKEIRELGDDAKKKGNALGVVFRQIVCQHWQSGQSVSSNKPVLIAYKLVVALVSQLRLLNNISQLAEYFMTYK